MPREQSPATAPALRALAACVRGAAPDELRGQVVAALEAGDDLCSFAAQHHLLSLLNIRIREAELQSVLDQQDWERISHEHAVLAHHQTHMFAAALEVLGVLQGAGVAPVLPIKGLALAALIWPQVLPRRLVDLDFLVAPDQATCAQERLCAAGFAPLIEAVEPYLLHFHAPTLGRAGVKVELHHGLWQSGRLPFGSPELDSLATRSVSRAIQDQPIRTPCPEDVAILIAAVLARDRFDVRLHQWADLYWLFTGTQPGLDRQRLRDLAGALRMGRLLNVVLRFAEELFGRDILPGVEWDAVCADAYAQLQPILWRRLVAGSRLAGYHAVPFDWIASRQARGKQRTDGVFSGEGAARSPHEPPGLWSQLRTYGGPLRAAAKAGGHAGRLLTSRLWRQEFREEIAIRRVLRALNEAKVAEARRS